MKQKERLKRKYRNFTIEDVYGFRVPGWVLDAEIIEIAAKLGFLKIVVNPRFTGVEKK